MGETESQQIEEQRGHFQRRQAMGRLVGDVVHELNNLLTAINGYSSLALQRVDGQSAIKRYLEEINRAGDRAANLTRELLAFGRPQVIQGCGTVTQNPPEADSPRTAID
jgi:signal transduction histidine kinase